jgi:hypothetical protein
MEVGSMFALENLKLDTALVDNVDLETFHSVAILCASGKE